MQILYFISRYQSARNCGR